MQQGQWVSTSPQNKKVVLEQFNGITDVWSPDGHKLADSIKAKDPNNIHLIRILSGPYANTTPDYKTTTGDEIHDSASIIGYPSGSINRIDTPSWAISRTLWGNKINSVLSQTSPVNVYSKSTLNKSTRELTVEVEVYYTSNSVGNTNRLTVALTQSNIIGQQNGSSGYPAMVVGTQYRHNDVLRMHITPGTWGEVLDTVTTGKYYKKTYTTTLPNSINNIPLVLEDIKIIAFVSESNSNILSAHYQPTLIPTPDTVTVNLSCDTCGVFVCPVNDDINVSALDTTYLCSTPAGYSKVGPDPNNCYSFIPNGPITDTQETCIISCDTSGACDTTVVFLYPYNPCDSLATFTYSHIKHNRPMLDTVILSGISPNINPNDSVSYSWNINGINHNGSSITISNPSDSLYVSLTACVYDSSGNIKCCDSSFRVIYLDSCVFFKANLNMQYDGVIGSSANFSSWTTGGTTSSYQWLYNGFLIPGATSSTLNIFQTTYSDTGWYCVVITGTNGCVDTSNCEYLSIDSIPAPNINCSDYTPFNYQKQGNIFTFIPINNIPPNGYTINYNWTFSNGQTVTAKNATTTFGVNTTNWAKLVVCIYDSVNTLVCCDSFTKTNIAGSACQLGCQVVRFNDSIRAYPNGGTPQYTYLWSNGKTTQFITDTVPGIYTVTITDSNNCTTTCSYTILTPGFTCPINADFRYSYSTTNLGTVHFSDSTTPSGSYTYNWDFGDSTTSRKKNPTHTYSKSGTYTIRLIVTYWLNNSNNVCNDTITRTINVQTTNPCNKFTPRFYTYYSSTNSGYKIVNNTNLTNYNVVNVKYDVSNGKTYTTLNPVIAFTKTGYYSIKMTMTIYDKTTGTTCTKTYTRYIYATNSVCSGFYASFWYSRNGKAITFTDWSRKTDSTTTYLYDFGDGNTSTSKNPSHSYSSYGRYKVTLTITKTVGSTTCTKTTYRIIQVSGTDPCQDSGFVDKSGKNCYNYTSPVCGCDSVTYKNSCEARKVGIKKYTWGGPCPNDTNYVTICGYIYLDKNRNCVYDSTDTTFRKAYIKIYDSTNNKYYFAYPNSSGYYKKVVQKGTYSIAQKVFYRARNFVKQKCPVNSPIIINATNGGQQYCNDFFDTSKNCQDLSISVAKSWNMTPGFTSKKYIDYSNNGPNPVQNVTINYRFLNNLTVKNTSSSGYTVNGNVISWSLGTLPAFSSGWKTAKFSVPTTLKLGTTVVDSVWITPTTGDCDSTNNSDTYIDTCVGSWDPNDKAVNKPALIDTSVKRLTYHIRFQNTGTAPAHNVVLEDQIDGNLDLSTFEVNNSSHPYAVHFDDAYRMYVEYENIMLPDSGTDQEGSNGFFNYSIELRDGLPVGTDIKNTAEIYFDFNDPVITNTTINTIHVKSTSGVRQTVDNNHISIYPNPVKDILTISIDAKEIGIVSYSIYDISGKSIMTFDGEKKTKKIKEDIDLKSLNTGIYILNVIIGEKNYSYKIVK